ncbi:MAG: GH3 auxin-responsive promoter family protein [Bacteroidetes bacterium]|nr:GH3 auxin-responsive promoter family protein [Bacteroidota bacterium]
MSFLSALSKPIASFTAGALRHQSMNAVALQEKIFRKLIRKARRTIFGKDHWFGEIKTYDDFTSRVPVRDYEAMKPYIDRMLKGESNILWPGKPLYVSKTSGTTSGIKYIPITKDSISNHINSTRNAMLAYIAETGKADFLNGKLIFISGSPALENKNGLKVGRLSGIVNHHVPQYLRRNQLPSWDTNCIEDFEEKIDSIVQETMSQNMTMISGIPPWVQMYFDKLVSNTGKQIKDIFPDFSLFIYGGVNYEPYRKKFEQTIGKKIDSIELYPASEGFIAFQDSQKKNDLFLNINSGIFFEFIAASEFFKENPKRISLRDVNPGVNYAIILSNNAGLWGYSLGDTIKFTSVNPFRIVVTGRIKHQITAFGEHVIAEEVENALMESCAKHHAHVAEFTLAPQVNPEAGEKPYHEWFIEFDRLPDDIYKFSRTLDESLARQNIYYKDLISGNILQPLKVRMMKKDSFIDYMRSQGKLGGQNKMPRLSNDRAIADELKKYIQ